MKKILLFLMLPLFILCSCNKKSIDTDIEKYTFTDYEGEKTVEYNPTNVALLYPSFGDIWKACGGVITIGVEDCITRGYANSEITIVGEGAGKTINMEALIASKPSFVILSHDFPNHDDYANTLKDLNIPYGLFEYSSYDDYLHILDVFSKINKNEEAYDKYGSIQKNKIDSIKESSKEKESKKVLILRALSTKVTALSKTNFVGEMVNDLNSINIADTNKGLSADLSIEIILKENPDVILIIPMGDEEVAFNNASKLMSDTLWQSLDAVKNNKVYRMEKELFHYKPNVRWDEAYELLYERIYN